VRRPLTLGALCAVIFACAFVLGRGGGTAAAPREGAQWTVPVVASGSAIPASLGTAPPIEVEAPAPRVRTGTVAGAGVRTTLAERLVPEAPASPVSPRLPAPVSAPAPQVPSTPSAPSPSAAPPSSKSAPAGGEGSPKIAHPGESFDTSG
jgi:hypothetical protein